MLKVLFALFLFLSVAFNCFSQEDLIYLKDNTVLKGAVVSYNAGDSLQFKTDWGGVLTVYMSNVDKIIIHASHSDSTSKKAPAMSPFHAKPQEVKVISPNETKTKGTVLGTESSNGTGDVCFKNLNNYARRVVMIHDETEKTYSLTLSKGSQGCSYDLPVGVYSYKVYSVLEQFNGPVVTKEAQFRIKVDDTKNIFLTVDDHF